MSNRALAEGVFRAWGVFWSLNVLVGLPQLLNQLFHRNAWGDKAVANYALSSQTIALGCEIVVVIFLFQKAEWLASLVFPTKHEIGLSLSAADFRGVLYSVVGLYFVLDGARHAVGSAYQLATRPRGYSQNGFDYLWQREPENLVRALGGTIAGALLLVGRRGLWDTWKRSFGRAPETDESSEPLDER